MIPPDRLAAIPKAELHCHLEGALYLETLWEFSQRHEPGRHASFAHFVAECTVPKGTAPGFLAFLNKFDALRFHYGTPEDLSRLAFESVFQYFHDCDYREFRFSPVFFARRLLKGDAANTAIVPLALVEEATTAVLDGLCAGVDMVGGYKREFILTCNRGLGYAVNKPALDLLHRPLGKRIKGLDLAGDESADASDFVKPFREWKDAGKMITIHAGEDVRAGGPRNIVDALDIFKADRIGHGVRAIEDLALVARLAAENIPLEVCPTSNVQTRAAMSEAEHPLKRLFDAGVRVTINTDDPVICGTNIAEEYAFAARLGLSEADLLRCTLNAIQAGMLPDDEKKNLEKQCALQ